jgi:hypothetical protein
MKEHQLENRFAPALADLNGGGVKLMRERIEKLLHEIRKIRNKGANEKIQILDIGCGNSPYFTGIDLSDVELTLTDRLDLSDVNASERLYNPFISEKFKKCKFPDDFKKKSDKILKGNIFDLVIFSSVLHEIYQQWNLQNLSENSNVSCNSNFSKWFFEQINDIKIINGDELFVLGDDSFVLIGEIYYRNIWSHEALERARHAQFLTIGHADPITAFPDPVKIANGAIYNDFTLESFDESNSVPLDHFIFKEKSVCNDDEVKKIFMNRRFAVQIYKHRMDFCKRLTGICECKDNYQITLNDLVAFSVHSGSNLTNNINNLNNTLKKWADGSIEDKKLIKEEYYKIFVENKDGESIVPGLFRNLSGKCAELVYSYFSFVNMNAPISIEFWFSISSCILNTRYLPSVRDKNKYLCMSVNPGEGKDANWSINTWTSIAFNTLLGDFGAMFQDFPSLNHIKAPSLFDWLNKNTELNPKKSISITYTRLYGDISEDNHKIIENKCIAKKDDGISAVDMEDAIIASNYDLWKNDKKSENNCDEHVLVLIPLYEFINKSAGRYINELTGFRYCEANSNDELGESIQKIKESIASVYLDFIFLRRDLLDVNNVREKGVSNNEMALDALKRFKNRWDYKKESNKISVFNDEEELLSKYKEASILLPKNYNERIERVCCEAEELLKGRIINSDVLPSTWVALSPTLLVQTSNDTDIPGNLMFFSDRLFGTISLDLIMNIIDKAFQAIHTVELEWKTKKYTEYEARTDTFSTMLSSFGHDGKRPAQTIEMILKNKNIPDKSARTLGRYISQSLVNRLSSYSRIPPDHHDKAYLIKQLESEADQARSPLWLSIKRLWEVEALNQFIRILVDDSEWKRIRNEGIFPSGFKWESAEILLQPLLVLGNRNIDVLEASNEIIEECVKNLANNKPSIIINYEGPNLLCPRQLSGMNGLPTIPKLKTILSFIFSELMTNMAKHAWHKNIESINSDGLIYSLRVRSTIEGYYFDVCFAPSSPDSPPDPVLIGDDRTITGITSLNLAIKSIGTRAKEELIYRKKSNSEETKLFSSQPFPYQLNDTICGYESIWTISTFGPITYGAFKEDI